ncbi:hypothetical protein [Labrys miyagiensis]|uniref:hypothetical protein n=1 Tax=Labrys miyagiensis TaxID=346912 RepID=UPI0024E0CB9F|nr:hypothetical protein [Labrys miyagiensis]
MLCEQAKRESPPVGLTKADASKMIGELKEELNLQATAVAHSSRIFQIGADADRYILMDG